MTASISYSQDLRKSSTSTFRRIIAVILLYSQLLPMAVAALAPNTQSAIHSQAGTALNNLSLTNRHLNLNGPLDWGVTYSDLTGTYFNAQYVVPLGERFAFGALGEYGNDQYRLNGTLGYSFSPLGQIKATVEQLGQRLPFQFDSGDIRARVHQDAYGAQLQHLLNDRFVRGVNARGYWAQAASKNLNPILFTSNGFNCRGFAAGLECINYRYLAGATSQGFDAGVDVLLTPSTLAKGNLYYDEVRYNTRFSPASLQDRTGMGFCIKIEQLFNERFKLLGEATVREIYDTYQVGVSILPSWRLNTEISLTGQRIVSRNAIPDNNSFTVGFKMFGDGKKHYEKQHSLTGNSLNNIDQWVRTPAVKMQQVLITAEQYTKVLGPSISSISPNNGPLTGGNTVTISGSNFMPGLTIIFGGQAATNIQVLSPTTITAVVPAITGISTETVDVIIQNPDGQQTSLPRGYTYAAALLPVITLINPSAGTSAGGTIVIISGANLGTTQSVTFGGIAAELTQITSNQVTVVTPPHAAGLVSIVLTTSSGSITQADAYTYVSVPAPIDLQIDDSGSSLSGKSSSSGTVIVTNNSGVILGQGNVAADGTFTITLNPTQTNGEVLSVTVTNPEGITSPVTQITAPDVTAPAAPTNLAVNSNGTELTGEGEPGTTAEAKDSSGSALGSAQVGADGHFTLQLVPPQTSGETISVTLMDSAGNISLPSQVTAPDVTAPAAPTSLEISSDGGTLTGNGEPGTTAEVRNASGTVIGSGPVDSNGNFIITLSPPQTNGETLSVTLKDSAGNISLPSQVTAPDVTAPAAPTNLQISLDGGTLTGNGEAGTTAEVKNVSGTVIGSGLVDSNGDFNIALSPVQTNGETLSVTLTDSAGNISLPSQVTAPDVTAPAAPTNLAVNSNGTELTGEGEPGTTATVKDSSGNVIGSGPVDSNGNFIITFSPPLSNGEILSVTLTDSAGNTSASSSIIV